MPEFGIDQVSDTLTEVLQGNEGLLQGKEPQPVAG